MVSGVLQPWVVVFSGVYDMNDLVGCLSEVLKKGIHYYRMAE